MPPDSENYISNDNSSLSDSEIIILESELVRLITEFGNEHIEVIHCLNELADCYECDSKYPEAEQFRRRALLIQENMNVGDDYSFKIVELGMNLECQGKFTEAEVAFRLAIETGERLMPDTIRVGYRKELGNFYHSICEYEKAEEVFRYLYQNYGNDYGLVLASLLKDMGKYSEAEELLCQLVELKELDRDSAYNILAILYEYTGRYEESEHYHRCCLAIREKNNGADSQNYAYSLMNIAWTIDKAGRHSEAELLCRKALVKIEEELSDKVYTFSAVANAISNYAIILNHCGRYEESLEQHYRALALREKCFPTDHSNHTLESVRELAHLHTKIGNYEMAESLYFRALKIAEHIYEGKYHPDFSDTLYGMASLCHVTNREPVAIFWAKKAINVIQKIRENISGIKADALRAFDSSVSAIYRELSEWLIDDGRLFEAQQVLSLLKEQECFEFVRRDASSATHVSEGLSYTEQESAQAVLYQSALKPLAELKSEQEALLANKQRSANEEQRLTELETTLEKAGSDFYATLAKISEQLGLIRENKIVEVQEAEGLMQDLSELGDHTVAIFTVICENCLHTILITPTFRKSFSSSIGDKELSKKIFEFRSALLPTNGKFYDPQPLAEELYSIIVAPLANELNALKTTTILWSLDGVLRYIPMNALHDGKRYLVESFCNTIITPASRGRLLSSTKKRWTGAGFGVTQSHGNFRSLPAVQKELSGIIRNPDNLNAILEGTLRLDADFNWASMKKVLAEHHPAVHIASHFSLSPCNDVESYLLLGDGEKLTLDRLRNQQNIFGGVDLLTLSACDTAVGSGTGKELDGFSMISQRQGAKSVLASLWAVEDSSTSILMQEFYRLRESGITKGEALRRVQVKLLNGEIEINENPVSRCETLFRFEKAPDRQYSHPYFWAPFVLIGNYL